MPSSCPYRNLICKAWQLSPTHQGEGHAHDDWHEDEVESGDLQQAAILIWVCVHFLILDWGLETFATLALQSGRLERKRGRFSKAGTSAGFGCSSPVQPSRVSPPPQVFGQSVTLTLKCHHAGWAIFRTISLEGKAAQFPRLSEITGFSQDPLLEAFPGSAGCLHFSEKSWQ